MCVGLDERLFRGRRLGQHRLGIGDELMARTRQRAPLRQHEARGKQVELHRRRVLR